MSNLGKLCALFLDKEIVGNALGPGDAGDFDNGAWHILCHLDAGCAVVKRPTGELMWIEISHVPIADVDIAAVTIECPNEHMTTFLLDSLEGRTLLEGANPLGFVEGTSLGHISARSVKDPEDKLNGCLRHE